MWDAGVVVFGTGLFSFVVVYVSIASVRGGSSIREQDDRLSGERLRLGREADVDISRFVPWGWRLSAVITSVGILMMLLS